MAQVFSAPTTHPAPQIDFSLPWTQWSKAEDDYINTLAELARSLARPGDDATLVGKVLYFPVADGKAQYMVWHTRPLQLVWLELGDAWQADAVLLRGLNLTDVRARLGRAEACARR